MAVKLGHASPDPGLTTVKHTPIKTSLEHLRIKKIESSDEDSEEYEEGDGNRLRGDYVISDSAGSMFPLGVEIPDVVLLDDIKSRRRTHLRSPSQEIKLTEVHEIEAEFSKSLVEQVNDHKRTLFQLNTC